ncbi:MAG: hypothetical protein CHACPFDD_00561 [Phycisphaerae bacterium]|nr:hypothetical protein [Phycisphaerae bacterium]
MKSLTPLALALFLVGCTAARDDSVAHQVQRVLQRQADAWNRGDVDAFMCDYVRGDDLTFSSGGETHRGWDQTLKRYRARYPDRASMGTLRFDQLETTPLGDAHALTLGRWHLTRAVGNVSGNFSLIWRRQNGAWRILHDHTSQSPAPPTQPAP